MSLKHRLLAIATVIMIVAATLGFLIYGSVQQYNQALRKEQISSQIALEVYQRRLLAGDYLLNPTERAKSQWGIKQAVIERLVSENLGSFLTDEENNLMRNIRNRNAASRENFAELVKLSEEGQGQGGSKVISLSSLLSINAQAAITDASKLQEINHSRALLAFNRLTLLFSLASVILLGLLTVGFLYIWRSADALIALDKAKTDFFNNVSHEFRTPLTLMLGPLEASLNRTDLPKDHLEQLTMMRRNTLRLQKLVNSLLDYARIESGKMKATFQPVDLAEYTRGLVSAFYSAMAEAKLDFIVKCEPLKKKVYIDPALWETIVLNLMSNAMKFTFKGHIKVVVERFKKFAELRIEDTGTGIPPDELKRLFERFHRVSGAKSRSAEGSGIGLALVSELVKLHGGTITAKSKVDHGTTFIVRIPFGKSHLPRGQIQTRSDDGERADITRPYTDEVSAWFRHSPNEYLSTGDKAQLKAVKSRWDETILVVDDNADMRDYVYQTLNPNVSLRVMTAASGAEALKIIKQKLPSLIISDISMPSMDGIEFFHEVRKLPGAVQVPFLFLSARAGENERLTGLAEGVDDYLTKPFSPNQLVVTVRTKLDLAQSRNNKVPGVTKSN